MTKTADLFLFRIGKHCDPVILQEAYAVLDENERARSNDYSSKPALNAFLLGRLMIKTEIGKVLGVPAKKVRLRLSHNGKPFLDTRHKVEDLHFSLSHSSSAVVLGIANVNIGVDVEESGRFDGGNDRMFDFFCDSIADQLKVCPESERPDLFTYFWTCLEAQVKLEDSSVFRELKHFKLHIKNKCEYQDNLQAEYITWKPFNGLVFSMAMQPGEKLNEKNEITTKHYAWEIENSSEYYPDLVGKSVISNLV